MNRTILTVFLITGLVASLFAAGQGEKTVKIGFIGPLTGDYANYGNLMTQAITIAVEERNEAGGIGGRPVTLIAEDSEAKVDKANAAIEKLASLDKIWGLVGCVFSASSLAVAPRCQDEKIVMISPSATHKDLTGKGDYIFRDVVSDGLQATVFAKYVAEVLNIKTVAILYIKNDYSQGVAEGFQQVYEASGGKVLAVETGIQGDKDFKTQLTKIKSINPEALFIPNYVAEIAQILDQVNQLGIESQLISADGFSNPEILDLAGELANGVIFSGPAREEIETENAQKTNFEEKYNARWGVKPDSFSLNAYDGANLLMDAITHAYEQADSKDKEAFNLNKEQIRQYLVGLEGYKGVSGEITFAENGDVIKNQGILTVLDGEYVQIGVYTVKDDTLIQVNNQ